MAGRVKYSLWGGKLGESNALRPGSAENGTKAGDKDNAAVSDPVRGSKARVTPQRANYGLHKNVRRTRRTKCKTLKIMEAGKQAGKLIGDPMEKPNFPAPVTKNSVAEAQAGLFLGQEANVSVLARSGFDQVSIGAWYIDLREKMVISYYIEHYLCFRRTP